MCMCVWCLLLKVTGCVIAHQEKRLSMSLEKMFDADFKGGPSLVDIQLSDVHEISASCCDHRLSHWNPFSKPSSSRQVYTL